MSIYSWRWYPHTRSYEGEMIHKATKVGDFYMKTFVPRLPPNRTKLKLWISFRQRCHFVPLVRSFRIKVSFSYSLGFSRTTKDRTGDLLT